MEIETDVEKTCRACMNQSENMKLLDETVGASESNLIYCDMIMACASVHVS